MYNGIMELTCSEEEMAKVYEGNAQINLLTNQYLICRREDGTVIDKFRWNGKTLQPLKKAKLKSDFKPKTDKQECLADLLLDTSIPIKLICGVAGSGKSKMSIMYGLNHLQKQTYTKMFVVRHNAGVGEKNGYVPGDKLEKIRAWMGFFEDNIEDNLLTLDDMIAKGMFDTDAVEYMKGRDLKQSWIIIDECEDLTEEQFKMLGERTSEGSAILFVGDYEQTTQEKYKSNSGIVRAINNLAGNPLVGIVVFDDKINDNVRSEASKVFSSAY